MNKLPLLLCFTLLCGTSFARRLEFENRSGSTIWVGSLGNPGHAPINNGGWTMNPRSTMSVHVADNWAGRVWGRTGCKFDGAGNGRCETGDCGNRLECRGNGGAPPVTLAEFTFRGHAGLDYYDISLVDGFNIPITMTPLDKRGGGDQYHCQPCSCPVDLNRECPDVLKDWVNGRVVACKSACLRFNNDQYCCRGAHNRPETCRSNTWPVDYPAFFKSRCPDAYSYAYDDHKSTFVCDNTAYKISLG